MPDTPQKFTAVMLIDDNEIDNLINQKMIEAADISETIYIHTGARSAIEFLKNVEKLSGAAQQLLPDIIFLDIDMPLMDGFQFLDEYEKLSELTKTTCRVVMLTSSINPQDLKRSKQHKYVSDYINKPLSQESLLKLASGSTA